MRRRRCLTIALSAGPVAAAVFMATPAAPTAAEQGTAESNATVVSATPISVVGPAWFDGALYQQVINSGAHGVPLTSISALQSTQSTTAAASTPCLYSSGAGPTGGTLPSAPAGVERPPVGLGPGTWLISLFCTKVGGVSVPDGFAWCTANFVFQNSGYFGLGTAGHCAASDALGSPVTAVVTPPPEVCANGGSCAPGIYAIGTFSVVRNNGLGDDFAIVKVYPQFNSWMRPTMPVYGGPTGSFSGGLAGVPGRTLSLGGSTVYTPAYYPSTVGFCGNGIAVGTGDTCRSGAALFASATWYAWYGASTPGDSGSGVELLGDYVTPLAPVPAVADLTHIIILYASINKNGQVTEGPEQPAMIAGTQISRILSIAGNWKLVSGGLP
ncbi:MAG: hypothetical protein E6J45_06660 [Chloroflexi bacterium]|nr:MAG: hypothetical protein E6J45_06660 [Chloroflexota bacterium]